jgi:hypothetical protein
VPLIAAVLVCACNEEVGMPPPTEALTTDFELQTEMRELWTAHVVWTRDVIIASLAGSPETPDATQRLLANQDQIADALRPFYGDAVADQLRALLREHITIALDVVYGASTGTPPDAALSAWYANADAIARLLSDASPALPFADVQTLMHLHLDQTIAEVNARLAGDWAADIAAFDTIVDHANHMADVLAGGITTQFPDLVAPSDVSARDRELHLAMGELWQDHVIWTRMYIIAALANRPEVALTAARLLQNQDEIGAAIGPFYGDAAATELARLLREHITIAVDVVYSASIANDPATQEAVGRWFANADAIASFLATANPYLPFAAVQDMMHSHLEQTIEEATARIAGDWPRDIAAYDAITTHILHLSDTLSGAIAQQFPEHAH